MVQLVVCVNDKTNPDDFYADCHCPKRGMVIDVFDDDFDLTQFPLVTGNTNWCIIQLPGAQISDVASLLVPEMDPTPKAQILVNPSLASKTLQYRSAKIDVDNAAVPDALAAVVSPAPAQGTQGKAQVGIAQAATSTLVQLALTDITPLIATVPPIADPAVLGAPPTPDPTAIG